MINFPWHVDFGAGVATTLAICAITALSHDQGHTGFHGRFRCCLSSGFPSKIKQSIFVDDAGGDPHDCTALSSAAVAPRTDLLLRGLPWIVEHRLQTCLWVACYDAF